MTMINNLHRDHSIRLALLILFLVLGYFGTLAPSGLVSTPRFRSQDQLLQLRHKWQRRPATARDIVLVKIDDSSLQAMGRQWPWDRTAFAQLLDIVGQGAPRAIAMDLAFIGSSSEHADDALAAAIRRNAPVFLAAYIDPLGNYVSSDPIFLTAGGVAGLINKPRDRDLVVRRLWPAVDLPGGLVEPEYAFEVKVAAHLLGVDHGRIAITPHALTITSTDGSLLRNVPLAGPTMLINPLVTARDIPSVSCIDVLRDRVPPETFAGKMVIVGTTTEATHDIHPTPLGLTPGVLLSANGLLTILSERYLKPVPLWCLSAACLGIALISGFAALYLSAWVGLLLTIGAMGAAFGLSLWTTFSDYVADWFSPVALVGSAWCVGVFYKYVLLSFAGARLRREIMTDVASGALTARQGRLQLRATYQASAKTRKAASAILIELARGRAQSTHAYDPAALKAVTNIQPRLPRGGSVARLSAQRFCVVLPNTTATRALEWAQQLHGTPEGRVFVIGLADTAFRAIRSSSDWLACAESALARAQQHALPVACFDPDKDGVVLGVPEDDAMAPAADDFTELMADLRERNRELEGILKELQEAHHETQEALFTTAKVLVRALETKDPYTAGHSERVSRYSARLAECLNLPSEQVEEIQEAGLLHDIGKIGLPEQVLHKVGALSNEERSAIRHHHAEGSRILEPLKHFKRIIPLIYYHHERYDGKGFPHGLAGDLIPVGAQIIAVVDSFDAMTTNRGYNVPKTPEQGLEELRRCAGTQFNPEFVEAFARMIQEEGTGLTGVV